jgi:hypothetical protein
MVRRTSARVAISFACVACKLGDVNGDKKNSMAITLDGRYGWFLITMLGHLVVRKPLIHQSCGISCKIH